MRFTPAFLDEIRTRLPVSQVVGRRVKLKKAGREWRGLSPFNAEKTPSFFVNDGKMAWFDFSSGRNGNIFDFVMETEGVSFPEAVERLAAEAGLEVPRRTEEDAVREQARAGLVEACEWAAQFFQSALKGREGAAARAYLDGRGLGPDVQAEFRLGFAPAERFALRDHLAGRGVSAAVMCEAGLLNHGEGIAVPYDKFRDRVMFPIHDRGGKVIAFGGRALSPDVPAKYLNSPETPLFHKGALLYNHHRARKPAADREAVIAVEGYVDVIALWRAGVPNAVASLGTALTPAQCDLLWRMAPEPILCFDGDAAGKRAAYKAVDTALPLIGPGRSLRFAFLPEGQDPDDLVRSGGAAAVARVLETTRPLVDVLWARETDGLTLDTPERRAGLERRLGDLAREIADEALRRHYGSELQGRLRDLTGAARRGLQAGARPWTGTGGGGFARGGTGRGFRPGFEPVLGLATVPLPALSASLSQSSSFTRSAIPAREVEICALILAHPDLLDWHAEDLAHIDFANPDVARLRDGLLGCLGDHDSDPGHLAETLDRAGHRAVRERVMRTAARSAPWWLKPEAAAADVDQILRQALTLQRKAGSLHRDLKAAQDAFARDDCDLNFDALKDVKDRLSALEGTEASLEGFGSLSGRDQSVV